MGFVSGEDGAQEKKKVEKQKTPSRSRSQSLSRSRANSIGAVAININAPAPVVIEHPPPVSESFKTHINVAAFISVLCLLAWEITAFVIGYHVPWFFYIWAVFALTLSTHLYIFELHLHWFSCHLAWWAILSCIFFTSWIIFPNMVAFFIYPMVVMTMFLLVHGLWAQYFLNPHRWVYLHGGLQILLNLLLFYVYLDTRLETPNPWIIFTFFGLAIIFATHWCLHYYPHDSIRLHLYVFVLGNMLMFYSYIAYSPIFPWFPFIGVPWGVLLWYHINTANPAPPPPQWSVPDFYDFNKRIEGPPGTEGVPPVRVAPNPAAIVPAVKPVVPVASAPKLPESFTVPSMPAPASPTPQEISRKLEVLADNQKKHPLVRLDDPKSSDRKSPSPPLVSLDLKTTTPPQTRVVSPPSRNKSSSKSEEGVVLLSLEPEESSSSSDEESSQTDSSA
eukprot:TRINITY_DN4329_c0_g1_i4.p1 TRINITY_DN4329_c0_g1~~TRINITY_DN4329_c0_g1_i4.p1  ORF type:complete len:447 (-),score=84.93 TRINITY_DN4329_c0_g1_i4:123-1463(-)